MMKNFAHLVLFVLFSCNAIFAQMSENEILFTVDGAPVYVDEFKRVYNKNLDLVKDESQKDVDSYLELFINYKLKLKEARSLGYHEKPKYKRELANYRKQLAKNYLTDTEVTEALIKEAYDRTAYEIRASHILIRLQENAAAADTLKVYNRLMDARKEIMGGKDFESVAKQYSEDPTVAENGGDLGFFGGFKMVYDFEDAAYNTKVGELSQPFRTKFGFHLVKVSDKRKSVGELTVAHIMVSNKKSEDTLQEKPFDRINDIYKKIQQGEDFETLAEQFSEDKASAKKGGLVNRFGKGQLMSDAFETAAFGLKEKGDITEPVQSDFGWHIIKLIDKHPVLSFNEMKKGLESKIKRGSRSKLITTAFKDKLKKQYNIPVNDKAISYFSSLLNADFYSRTWTIPESLIKDGSLATIGKKTITYNDFANYLLTSQKKMNTGKPFNIIVRESYDEFIGNHVLGYHEEHLEEVNEDFRVIVEEYRDGLLLFDLMESEVWNAAKKDSIRLNDYFTKNAADYKWNVRAMAEVASSADKAVIAKVKKYLEKGWDTEKIKATINKKGKLNVIFTKDTMDMDHRALPKDFKFKEGVSDIYDYNKAHIVVKVDELIESSQKSFEEAKGAVLSDFQEYFEDNWIQTLRNKYKVSVDSQVMDKVRQEINK